MNIDQQQAAFEAWVAQFDTYSDEYQDMGADQYFIAGYQAALQSQDDPLQPAANWLFKAIAECKVADIRWALRIGHNRAQRLFDHARRVEGES